MFCRATEHRLNTTCVWKDSRRLGRAVPMTRQPEHDKLIRMSNQSAKFESGQFFPNRALWLADLETELFAFPNARHDNQVDSLHLIYAGRYYFR
jgi:predicted phage terminase large subunit-like protein